MTRRQSDEKKDQIKIFMVWKVFLVVYVELFLLLPTHHND